MLAAGLPHPPLEGQARRAPGTRWPVLAAVAVAVALAVRLGTWDVVFQPAGVMMLADSDPHYHVLRAERMLHGAPGAPWRDPGMNWPFGADLVWPPLFDAAIAAAVWVAGGSAASREEIARVAAFVPVALGLLTVLLVAALGRWQLGRRRGWIAALLVAALPAHGAYTVLGRPDQHAAELALFAALLVVLARASRREEPRAAVGLGLLVAVSFWTWQGSAVLLAVPLLVAVVSHACAPAPDQGAARAARALAAAGLGGAFLLAATLATFGPPGALARPAVGGANVLHVAIAAGAGATGALLLAFGRRAGPRNGWRRAAEAAAAVVLPAAALLGASPALRSGSRGGLDALLGGNAWYGNIGEFRPMFLGGSLAFLVDLVTSFHKLGLLLPLAAAALPAVLRRWRSSNDRTGLLLLWLPVLTFLVAALARQRFIGYLTVAAAVPAEAGIRSVAAGVARRARTLRWSGSAAVAAGALLVVSPAVGVDLAGVAQLSKETATAAEAFVQLRALAPAPGREAVLAPWSMGHLVQYYWGRPVVVTPFGVEGGAGAFEAWAAFFFARTGDGAEAAVSARRVGWVVLDNPANAADELLPFAPTGTSPLFTVATDLWEGKVASDTAAFWTLVPTRLYFRDGRGDGGDGGEALTGFRLVLESPPTSPGRPSEERQLKVFGAVPGARAAVAGAAPGRLVDATVRLRTNLGRALTFSVAARAAPDGSAALRLPYATGWNGLVWAEEWAVTDGDAHASMRIDEADVLLGRPVEVAMSRRARAAR